MGEELEIDFSEEDFETLNGLMISRLERIPEDNEDFDMDYGGYNFKILAVLNKTLIFRVSGIKLASLINPLIFLMALPPSLPFSSIRQASFK